MDLATGTMALPDTKTGKKSFSISPKVVELLTRAKAEATDTNWVIPGRRHGKHMDNLQKPWERIRKRAGLNEVRLHDLRHSYASVAAMSGQSLLQIGAQLGHTQPQTTKRYAHIGDRSLADRHLPAHRRDSPPYPTEPSNAFPALRRAGSTISCPLGLRRRPTGG